MHKDIDTPRRIGNVGDYYVRTRAEAIKSCAASLPEKGR
jgi:hypothetical protein